MNKSIRNFGIGIFLAGAAWTATDYYFSDTVQSANESKISKESTEQVAILEKQLQQAEAKIEQLEEQSTTSNQKSPASETKTSDKADEKEEIVTDTIYIYEGVSLYDIGKQAEDLGIVANGRELELYLFKPEYAKKVQIGQFELSSNMTLEEMALVLTGQ